MRKISIFNFKGIHGPLDISLVMESGAVPSNFLLYSENGGGKTSIAEAVKLACGYTEWESQNISPTSVGENRQQDINSALVRFLNTPSEGQFKIELSFADGVSHLFSNLPNPQEVSAKRVFVLGRRDLMATSRIDLNKLINKWNVRIDKPISDYLDDGGVELIISEVNKELEEVFREDIRVVRMQEPGYFIAIEGVIPNGHVGHDIDLMVNEARQNLVKILLFLNFLKCLSPARTHEDTIVILDDIMSSLDLANRIVLARYLVDYGRNYQLFVMTHNVGFYNLMVHTAKVEGEQDRWIGASLYRIGEQEEIVINKISQTVADLVEQYGVQGRILPSDPVAVNAMRKKFESLLHEFAKVLTLGVKEETETLIAHLVTAWKEDYYCCIEGTEVRTSRDLLRKIAALARNEHVKDLRGKINQQLQKYKDTDQMKDISETIRHLRIYQKVVLHPGSHDQGYGISFASEKEITLTLELMRKLESVVNLNSASYPYFL